MLFLTLYLNQRIKNIPVIIKDRVKQQSFPVCDNRLRFIYFLFNPVAQVKQLLPGLAHHLFFGHLFTFCLVFALR
jgi:hypothetical protein